MGTGKYTCVLGSLASLRSLSRKDQNRADNKQSPVRLKSFHGQSSQISVWSPQRRYAESDAGSLDTQSREDGGQASQTRGEDSKAEGSNGGLKVH